MTMTRKFAGAAVLAVLALAGCGGSSTEGSAPTGAEGGNIRLVAYSTPREAYAKLIELYRGGAGEGVSFQQSYGASGEQSRARRGGPARRRRRVLARARHDAPGRVRRRREGLERRRAQGHGHGLRRRLHGPRGQPEGDQDLGRPDEGRRRGPDPEPVHVRRRPLERDGRLRRPARAGQDARAGARLPEGAVRERRRSGQERARVVDDVRLGQGRRPPRLRERGDLRAAPGPAARVRRSRPDDPDREPGRDHRGRERRGARASSTSSSPTRRRRCSARRATARS